MGGKLLAAAKPLPIGGHGTEADPFRVKFPVQEVVWFLP
jgi:hypothetical protein